MFAVIFDMDGVLFDSEPLHMRAWRMIMNPFGIEHDDLWFFQWIGFPDKNLASHLKEKDGLPLSIEEIVSRKWSHFRKIVWEELKPFPGVKEGLKQLRDKNVPLAVASSAAGFDVRNGLECTGLAGFFDAVVTAEDVKSHKPAPDSYLKAAAILGKAPEHAIALEDSIAGIQAAKTAGCTVLAIASSHSADQLKEAHYVFPSTAEALSKVLQNGKGMLSNKRP